MPNLAVNTWPLPELLVELIRDGAGSILVMLDSVKSFRSWSILSCF